MNDIENGTPATGHPMADQDLQHLRLLVIFHYVVGGLIALFACFPLIHVALGTAMISGYIPDTSTDPAAQFAGWLFIAVGSVISLLGWSLAAATIWSGRNLAAQRRWTACLVIAALLCMFAPVGTVLGVFTILVLERPSVKVRFGVGA